jgi:glycosyltransferase 2 family protein
MNPTATATAVTAPIRSLLSPSAALGVVSVMQRACSVQSLQTMRRAEGAVTETVVDQPRGAANRRRRSALTWFGVLVSIAFAYLAVRDVQLRDVWDGLRSSNYLWLLPALAMLAVAVLLKAIRWRYLYARETRPPTGPVVTSTLVGYFFNSILPLRAGEVARVVALKRRAGTSMAESSATVVIEHAYDVLILLVLLFVTAPWLPQVNWIDTAAALAIALSAALVATMIVLAVWGLRPLHFLLRPLARLPFLSAERVEHIGDNLGQGLAALRRPGLVVAAIGLTTLFWLAVAASTWFLMIGFHLHVSLLGALLVVAATTLAMVLPSAPSALGVFEAAVLVALGAYGISDADALSFALVFHALNILPWLVAGVLLLRGRVRTRPSTLIQ